MSVAWIFILPLRIGTTLLLILYSSNVIYNLFHTLHLISIIGLFGAIPFSFGDRSAIWPFITVALGVPSVGTMNVLIIFNVVY